MQHLRRTGILLRSRLTSSLKSHYGLNSSLDGIFTQCAPDMGFAPFSSAATAKAAISGFVKREGTKCGKNYAGVGNYLTKVKHEAGGSAGTFPSNRLSSRSIFVSSRSLFQLGGMHKINSEVSLSARPFTSKASEPTDKNKSEPRKDISAFEDPFDAPTDVIPEKPVTFTEGASYSLVILAGLGVAVAAGYAVFSELIFQPKEYKIFGKALKRIQDDSEVRVRIGSPITGYGSESRNRAARQRIPNKVWVDEDKVEHIEVMSS
ncbi:OLC1v1038590C1 [Oldenlandia corymbosa var. corymbosa]|uniref:Mitochondrial import inner membrane translocase subunit Tim21 n=1 Tax=Oldenlandia corymbosa var. corymbosa TaxID=529605 RepID=A0AAV1D373_OLDCO|nr:OLC1v1038590C1 [Oldenlandia corymbosa var. corymbosa]